MVPEKKEELQEEPSQEKSLQQGQVQQETKKNGG